ncbi:MAG: DUF2062 domain-containing protein [Pseudomonadota bacterium]
MRVIADWLWPRGGWGRAAVYVWHRIRRLPDPAHRISRGIAAGVFASFTPFYGFHFVTAGLLAWFIRGNILASLLSTFFGNPLTFPIIASVSVTIGTWVLGQDNVPLPEVVHAFSRASVEIWHNVKAIFTVEHMQWGQLGHFFRRVFLPYLVGGLVPGVLTAALAYFLANPIIASYQQGRIRALKERFDRRRKVVENSESGSKRPQVGKPAE